MAASALPAGGRSPLPISSAAERASDFGDFEFMASPWICAKSSRLQLNSSRDKTMLLFSRIDPLRAGYLRPRLGEKYWPSNERCRRRMRLLLVVVFVHT